MGTMGLKIKVMPNSPEVDLTKIEERLKEIVESENILLNLLLSDLMQLLLSLNGLKNKHLKKLKMNSKM